MRPLTNLIAGLSMIILIVGCKKSGTDESSYTDQLGKIHIEVSGDPQAIPHFEAGLLLMHNFEYEDAAEAFRKAREIDPGMAMAYWGEAMTHNHPLWRQLNKVEGLEVLELLGSDREERLTKVGTEMERDLFMGAEILFGEGSKNEKDIAYRDHMEKLFNKYPKSHEVASLYALSILGAVKGGRDYEAYEKGARIAQSIIDENPNHPGALHYLIHSYDDPLNAPKALPAANSYSKVAADAGHALHMPSHIYVSMGMWDEVVSSNQESWEASVNRKARKSLDNDALGYHSFKWLMYGHLQRGEFDIAKKMVEDMQRYCSELPSSRAKDHLVMMKGAYFTETGHWNDNLVFDTFDYSGLNIQTQAVHLFNQSMVAYNNDNINALENNIAILEDKIYNAGNEALAAASTTCSGNYGRNLASQTNVNRATVILLEIKALVATLKGEEDIAEQLIKEAVSLEEQTSFMYGPPDIVKPSGEFYADWLMERSRYGEAEKYYQKVLERAPKRLLAVEGIKQARQSS